MGVLLKVCAYAWCGVCFQCVCIVLFLLLSLWGIAALLETTHILGVQTIPGGVAHTRG